MNIGAVWKNSTLVRKLFIGSLVILILLTAVAYIVTPISDNSRSIGVTRENSMAESAAVSISSRAFNPETIEVKKGTTITWSNDDTDAHIVASDPHPSHDGFEGLDSVEPIAPGESYQFTFYRAGTYTYHDHLNPLDVKGTVIVVE